MNKISLGKKIFQFKNASMEDIKKWIELSEYNISLNLFTEILNKLDVKDIKKFCEHVTKFNENNVTLDLFLTRPKTPVASKIAKHYNTKISINYKNVYDPEYIMNRHGLTYEQSIEYISNYKKKKSTSKENFIKKYGEEEGLSRYNDWFNSSLKKGYESNTSKSKFSKEYYTRNGFDETESIRLALEYQYNNSPLHLNYYILRNKDIDTARKEIRKIHDRKRGKDSYREHLTKKGLSESEIDDIIKDTRGHFSREKLGDIEFEIRLAKIRKIFEDKGLWIPLEKMDDFQYYRYLVNYYTNKNDLTQILYYDKRGLAGIEGAYHLDHKYSVTQGYINGVSPELIGSLKNLEFIPWEINTSKQSKCSITLEGLANED